MSPNPVNQSSFGCLSNDEHAAASPGDEAEDWEIVNPVPPHQDETHSKKPEPAFSWRFQFSLELSRGSPATTGSQVKIRHDEEIDTPTASEQQQCRLFTLPPELRLRIYNDVLSCPSMKVIIKRTLSTSNLAILQTCRRIFAEAETIFYSINELHLVDIQVANGFIQTISAERRNAIRSISFLATSSSSALAMIHAITPASQLQILQIHRQQSIRYTDVRSWAVLAKQIKSELSQFHCLYQLEFITPDVEAPTPLETERRGRLTQIDRIMTQNVKRRDLSNTPSN